MLANQALNLRSLPTRGARAQLRQRFLERQKAADIQLESALLFPRQQGAASSWPTTAIGAFALLGMGVLLLLQPLASVARWRGRSPAGPCH